MHLDISDWGLLLDGQVNRGLICVLFGFVDLSLVQSFIYFLSHDTLQHFITGFASLEVLYSSSVRILDHLLVLVVLVGQEFKLILNELFWCAVFLVNVS